MESTLSEITDETIVCFQQIKVRMLAGKKKNASLKFLQKIFFFDVHQSGVEKKKGLISQATVKN